MRLRRSKRRNHLRTADFRRPSSGKVGTAPGYSVGILLTVYWYNLLFFGRELEEKRYDCLILSKQVSFFVN
jgi:hypothetical protein